LKNISTFQKCAFGATFRKDGMLIIAGDEEAKVRVFDVNTKSVLRVLKGHSAPVHRAYFANDLHHVFSCSDDKTVKYWDLATEKSILNFREHSDYVRAGAINPVSDDIILSGGYDGQIKMLDTRSKTCAINMNHGAPIESLLFLPSGGIIVSSGGSDIKIWDAIAGGRQLMTVSQHTKTVTCLKTTSDGRHLISGSLDRHVKFFNTTNYQCVHSSDYANSVLSVGISKDDDTLAVGTVDGTISVHRREQKVSKEKAEPKRERKSRFQSYKLADEFVEKAKKVQLEKHDRLLRKFEYSQALSTVLSRHCMNRTPEVTVALMQELMRRQGLETAFANRSQDSIGRILTFFNKYLSDSRFTRTLIDIVNIFLNVYEDSFHTLTPEIQRLIIQLHRRIKQEEELTLEFLKLQGELDIIMNAATGVSEDQQLQLSANEKKLEPSINAQKASVIKV
jgi:U3 small nucleolar RNA-associated protein 15